MGGLRVAGVALLLVLAGCGALGGGSPTTTADTHTTAPPTTTPVPSTATPSATPPTATTAPLSTATPTETWTAGPTPIPEARTEALVNTSDGLALFLKEETVATNVEATVEGENISLSYDFPTQNAREHFVDTFSGTSFFLEEMAVKEIAQRYFPQQVNIDNPYGEGRLDIDWVWIGEDRLWGDWTKDTYLFVYASTFTKFRGLGGYGISLNNTRLSRLNTFADELTTQLEVKHNISVKTWKIRNETLYVKYQTAPERIDTQKYNHDLRNITREYSQTVGEMGLTYMPLHGAVFFENTFNGNPQGTLKLSNHDSLAYWTNWKGEVFIDQQAIKNWDNRTKPIKFPI